MTRINENTKIGDSNTPLKRLIPYILYNDSSGTSGTVNLSDSINNYEFIEIYCSWYDTFSLPVIKLSRSDIKNGKFQVSFNSIGNDKIIYSKTYNISGNTITKDSASYYIINRSETSTWDVTKINKVIGYK